MKKELFVMIALLVVAIFVISACSSGDAFRKASERDRVLSQPCIDTDGKVNPYRFGQVSGDFGKFADECINDDILREYYCYKNDAKFQAINCRELGYELGKDYFCDGGACVENLSNDLTPPTLDATWTELDNGFYVLVNAYDDFGINSIGGQLSGPNTSSGSGHPCNGATHCSVSFNLSNDGPGSYDLVANATDVYGNWGFIDDSNYLEEPVNTSFYPYHFITDGVFNGYFVKGDNAQTQVFLYLIDISADMNKFATISPYSFKTDLEVDLGEANMIIVGSACDNTIVADLMGNPVDCTFYQEPGIGILRAFEYDDTYILVVDGYGLDEMEAAKNLLLNLEDYPWINLMNGQPIYINTTGGGTVVPTP